MKNKNTQLFVSQGFISPPFAVTVLLIATYMLFSTMAYGQGKITADGGGYIGDISHTSGNVGIGTSNPQKNLHIYNTVIEPVLRITHKSDALNPYNWDILNYLGSLKFQYHITGQPITTKMQLKHTGQLSLGTETPDVSAIFQADATDKGILIPRLTDSEMNSIITLTNGLLIYNTDQNAFAYHRAEGWVYMTENSQLDDYLLITDFESHPAYNITTQNINEWNEAYSWDDHSTFGYITEETDPEVGDNTLNFLAKWDGSKLISSTIFENTNEIIIGLVSSTVKIPAL